MLLATLQDFANGSSLCDDVSLTVIQRWIAFQGPCNWRGPMFTWHANCSSDDGSQRLGPDNEIP